jgi:hypothetical protein
MHHPGYVFGVVDVVTAFFARAKLRGPLFDFGVELVGVVEGGYHDVSALSPIRVIAVVLNDPAIDAVIIRVHLGHAGSIRAASDPNLVRRYWARIELEAAGLVDVQTRRYPFVDMEHFYESMVSRDDGGIRLNAFGRAFFQKDHPNSAPGYFFAWLHVSASQVCADQRLGQVERHRVTSLRINR